MFFFSLYSVYATKQTVGLWPELKAMGQALLASFGVLVLIIFLLDYDDYSRLIYLYFIITNTVMLVAVRLGLRIL